MTHSPSHAPNILIVDDTLANLQLLAEIVKGQGYEIRAALSGRLALQSIRNAPPDLVLLDVNMPDISGYEVCRQIKAQEAFQDIPIIFVSGLTDSATIVKAFTVGGVDYITKPFQINEVLARIQTHLKLRRQQRELQQRHIELANLEEMRDNLVHMIIHDMRNPLLNTHLHLKKIEGLKDITLPASARESIQEAISSTDLLMEMMNSILDVSKMEAGLIPLSITECDLPEIIRDLMEKAALFKKSRILTLEVRGENNRVKGDQGLLTRVISNLLTNAMTYTSETSGEIRFLVESDRSKARVNIQDNGPGIPPEFHHKIFEKFFQVKSALSGQRHSTGLGLTFCQLAVEAHGGRIGVQSTPQKGSLFWFEIPVDRPSQAAAS